MHITYANKKVELLFTDYNLMKRKISTDWVRTIKKHMDRLKASDCFGDFLKLRLGKPEPLSGYNVPTYSVHVSANVRLVFELICESRDAINECTELIIKGVCDYHGNKENWFIP